MKLNKTATKPTEDKLEEPQVAKTKKPVKKPEEQKEFIDDYERPELEKYDKMTPTPSDRAKKQNGVDQVDQVISFHTSKLSDFYKNIYFLKTITFLFIKLKF